MRTHKTLVIISGSDWSDAGADVLIKITEKTPDELYKKYCNAGRYGGTKLFFEQWLIKNNYCRLPNDYEVEFFNTK
jgi:hypothetical protein